MITTFNFDKKIVNTFIMHLVEIIAQTGTNNYFAFATTNLKTKSTCTIFKE